MTRLQRHRYEEVGGQCWGECRICGNVRGARVHQVVLDVTELTQQDWLAIGESRGWIGPAVCVNHDGVPTTANEDAIAEEGGDPCVFMMRVYADDEERVMVEANHPPSEWRKN